MKTIYLLFLVCVFGLSACSSGAPAESPATAALPTASAADLRSATDDQPQAEPTAMPTATSTSVPEPTPAPTAIPTVAPESATVGAPATAGDCANRYLPVAQGASWEYQMSGVSTGKFTRVIAGVRPDGFDDQDSFDFGATRASSWACRNGALIALTPPSNPLVTAAGMQFDFTVESNEGVTFPADPKPGQSWTQKVVYLGEQSGGGVTLKSRSVAETSCKAVDIEAVVVPAGAFEALRVNCKTTVQITLSGGPAGLPGLTLNLTETRWLAPGVGLVKSSSASDMGAIEIVLLSYRMP